MCSDHIKVRKTARIRNRYNQVPHLSMDTKLESNKITINIKTGAKISALSDQLFIRQMNVMVFVVINATTGPQ